MDRSDRGLTWLVYLAALLVACMFIVAGYALAVATLPAPPPDREPAPCEMSEVVR